MFRVLFVSLFGLVSLSSVAEVIDAPPDFLVGSRWASAEICGPEARLFDQDAIDSYSGDTPLIYLNEFGLSHASDPVFCSFHTLFGGPMAQEGIYLAHLVCAEAERLGDLVTIALLHQPETVSNSTPKLVLRDNRDALSQDLYMCRDPG